MSAPTRYRVIPKPRSVGDIIASILLLLIVPAALVFYAIFALFVAFAEADNSDVPDYWFLVTIVLFGFCIVLWIIDTVVTIMRLVRRRRGWPGALTFAILICGATLLSIEHWAYVFG